MRPPAVKAAQADRETAGHCRRSGFRRPSNRIQARCRQRNLAQVHAARHAAIMGETRSAPHGLGWVGVDGDGRHRGGNVGERVFAVEVFAKGQGLISVCSRRFAGSHGGVRRPAGRLRWVAIDGSMIHGVSPFHEAHRNSPCWRASLHLSGCRREGGRRNLDASSDSLVRPQLQWDCCEAYRPAPGKEQV